MKLCDHNQGDYTLAGLFYATENDILPVQQSLQWKIIIRLFDYISDVSQHKSGNGSTPNLCDHVVSPNS